MPYDQFAYAILTASGSNVENPPAAYYKVLRTPEDTMENTTQLFLAVRFNCNKCHDHPFERWTQGQYYHLAAFFAQVGRKEDPAGGGQKLGGTDVEGGKPLIEDIYDTGSGEVIHLGTGKVAAPLVSLPARRSGRGPRPPAANSWPSGSPRRTTSISPAASSTAYGDICSARASSIRSTTSAPAIRPAIRNCWID